jgi:hypothetical protein
MAQQSVRIDWQSSASQRALVGMLSLGFQDQRSKTPILRLILRGQFVVDQSSSDPLHGDMLGLPEAVWLAIAREIYDTARGIVLSRTTTSFSLTGIPSVQDESFSIGVAPDDLGISYN